MHRSLGSLALATAVVVCACSQKEAAKTDSPAVAQSGGATPANSMFDPATRTAMVRAKDFAFEAPDTITAGWTTFHLMNQGPNLHHVQLIRIDSGKTIADLEAALKPNAGPPPSWMVPTGGPNAPNPGAESSATFDLKPGNYALICFVDIPGKVPHFAKGMIRPLTVTAAANATGAEPSADVTIAATDYAFAIQGPLTTAGQHTVKFVNNGPQEHEVEILRFAPGKTMKDVGAWMVQAQAGKAEGPPPVDAIGGITGEIKGMTQYFTANLTPGNYILLCFVPDSKDGKAHMDHGMVKEFTVK